MKRVDVIVPTWNGRHLLPFCLQAVRRQDEIALGIVVVDDGSDDDTAAWLSRHHPEVVVLRLPRRAGFAAAINAGVAATSAPYVLTLNNDAAIAPGYVRVLADFLDAHAEAAACQGMIFRHDDPSVIDSLGIRFDAAMRAFQEGHGQQAADRPQEPRRLEGVGACAALYRRRALAAVADAGDPPAVFDPSFFAYYEDVDLALRLAAGGWSSYLVPEATAEHVGSATGGQGARQAFLLGRNYFLYLTRHAGLTGLLRRAPRLAGVQMRRLLTLPAHPRRDLALWAGELSSVPGILRALRRRRASATRGPTG